MSNFPTQGGDSFCQNRHYVCENRSRTCWLTSDTNILPFAFVVPPLLPCAAGTTGRMIFINALSLSQQESQLRKASEIHSCPFLFRPVSVFEIYPGTFIYTFRYSADTALLCFFVCRAQNQSWPSMNEFCTASIFALCPKEFRLPNQLTFVCVLEYGRGAFWRFVMLLLLIIKNTRKTDLSRPYKYLLSYNIKWTFLLYRTCIVPLDDQANAYE